jgi:hypothetical protein
VLRLDRERRWFRPTDEIPAKPVTNADLVLESMEEIGSREIRTADIVSALAGKVNRRTVMDCLNRLADAGKVENTARGRWAVIKVCAVCATLYRDLHNCTNGGGEQKELLQMELAARAVPPVNCNGSYRAGDNQNALKQ